ncbi:MAG TPA: hypothetical protein VGQ47_02670 [Candidatus Limnocylindrales bacterium]|nr:hypothetical protein [Candidatus Limnocylindrales bacterium]
MDPRTIAGSLAYINWTVLFALALGSFGVVVLGRLMAGATRGYLAFTSGCAALLALLALLTDLSLPAPTGLAIEPAPALDQLRQALLGAFVVLAAAYTIVLARDGRLPALALAGLLAGVGAAVLAAVGWAGSLVGGVPLAVQFLVLAAATGGVLAAMILGHWYLVTPRLSERPLVLVARLLTAVVCFQVVLFVVWAAAGTGAGGQPFAALLGSSAVFVWLRLTIGLLFPLVVSWMAFRTASTRSMESATGLLYIDTAAIAAGTIVAAGLYFAAGLLV